MQDPRIRCWCHEIFDVVQDSRERVIVQQHGCCTVLASQKCLHCRARFAYTIHSCKMVAGRTGIIVFYKFVRSETIIVIKVSSLRRGNIMQIALYVVMHGESATTVYE